MLEALLQKTCRMRVKTLKPFGQTGADNLRISIGDLHESVAARLADHFQGVPAVEIVHGNLLDLDCQAIVSPANSFGDMGGGIDKAIDDFHGGQAQRRAVDTIRQKYYGELPVGAALIVELPALRFPFIVVAPTMRVPGSVRGSINAYLSMRAALVVVLRYNEVTTNPIRSLAIPGLGTGVGGLDPSQAAQQMRAAYDNVIGGRWLQIVHSLQAPYAMGPFPP